MPKGVRSPRGLPDADRRLSPSHRATIQNTPDPAPAPDGLPSIVQRARTSPGAVSPSEIVTLQRAIGMRAVGSLIAPPLDRERGGAAETETAPLEESDDRADSSAPPDSAALAADFGGGKGADGFAIRRPDQEDDQEQAPSGGKGHAGGLPGYLQLSGRAGDDDERAGYRQEIASFQARNPRERIVSRQRDVLDPGLAVDVGPDAHAGTLRRKGKGS